MASPASLVGRLTGSIDDLLAADAGALSDAEVQQLAVAVQAERSRLAVAAAAVLAEWQRRGAWRGDGSLRAGLALGRDTRSCHRRSAHELHRAARLARMPFVRAAVLAGRLSIDHVDLFVRYATAERWDLFTEHEELLVDRCASLALFDDARRVVQYWAQLADDVLQRRRDRPAPSTLYASRSQLTGELALDGRLSAVDAEIVDAELRRLINEVRLDDRRAGVHRTAAQRRAAALVRMATRSVNASGVTARPLFQVIVGDVTAQRLCELASGAVVHPDELAPHLDTAVIESFLFDGPSVVIAKTHRRTFTGALRSAIRVRDRRCQHRSVCPEPAVHGDIDHRRPVARGGSTSQFNGHVECIPHNRLAHLHDEPGEWPERAVDRLDELRCRLRWRFLAEE
jgi:hypothetical protein